MWQRGACGYAGGKIWEDSSRQQQNATLVAGTSWRPSLPTANEETFWIMHATPKVRELILTRSCGPGSRCGDDVGNIVVS
jgi:hypothetical protein